MSHMRTVRFHGRTAIIGMTATDLGIVMDALEALLRQGFESDTPAEFSRDAERLRGHVRDLLFAMWDSTEGSDSDASYRD